MVAYTPIRALLLLDAERRAAQPNPITVAICEMFLRRYPPEKTRMDFVQDN